MLSEVVVIDVAPTTPRERNVTTQVQDCMRVPAVTCGPETKLVEVARQMEWEEIGSVVVVDGDDRILGIITDRDLVNAMAHDLPASSAAREVMAGRVMSIHEHEDVYDAAAKMAAARCRRLPVVNAAGKLVGVVAIDNMVSAFAVREEDSDDSARQHQRLRPLLEPTRRPHRFHRTQLAAA